MGDSGISNDQIAELLSRGLIGSAAGAVGVGATEYLRGGQISRGVKLGAIIGAAVGVFSGTMRDPRVKLAAISALMAATAVVGLKKLVKPLHKKSKFEN